MDAEMFINIGDEELKALATAVVCRRCGALILDLPWINLAELHDQHHRRNDHGDTVDLGASPL